MDTLYVTSASSTIRYYDLDTKTETGSFTITDTGAMAIAVDGSDPNNVLVFTTTTTQSSVNGLLTKYNVNTNAEATVALGADGRGVGIHPVHGLVYAAVGLNVAALEARVQVYDQATLTLQDNHLMGTGATWSPTDLWASTVVFGGSVAKTCTSHPGGIAAVNDTVTYQITITNNGTNDINILPLEDTYDTTYLEYLSASVAPDDPTDDGQLNWADLTTTLGNTPAGGGTATITVNFRAKAGTPTPTNNVAVMSGALNTGGDPIPDAAGSCPIEILAGASITVTSPNGGEAWKPGTVRDITWTSSGTTPNLKISLWKDGVRLGLIAAVTAASGSHSWTVGQHDAGTASKGTGYFIKIMEIGGTASDRSDSTFRLTSPYGILIPNGGEDWTIGTTQVITWLAPPWITNKVKLSLWKDDVRLGLIDGNLTAASGAYSWTVGNYEFGTALAGTGYKVRIMEQGGTTLSDKSDETLTLSD